MNALSKGIVCLAAIICFAGPVQAQEEMLGPEAGDVSLAPSISFSFFDTGGTGMKTLALGAAFEYYFLRQLSLGVNLVGTIGDGGAGTSFGDLTTLSFFPTLTYYFQYAPTQRVAPYIGFGGGLQYFKFAGVDERTSGELDFLAGLDIYLTGKTALFLAFRDYLVFVSGGDQNNILLSLGLKVVF